MNSHLLNFIPLSGLSSTSYFVHHQSLRSQVCHHQRKNNSISRSGLKSLMQCAKQDHGVDKVDGNHMDVVGVNIGRRGVLKASMSVALGFLTADAMIRRHDNKVNAAEGVEGAISRIFFPKQGFNVNDKSLVRGNAVPDANVMSRADVKKSLGDLRSLRDGLKGVRSDFESNPVNFDVGGNVEKMIGGVEKLRDDLNRVNEAFDEEVQKKTDRLVRGIIQDVEEVEAVSLIRGGSRTPKKIERTRDWLEKVQGDFEKLLALYD